MQTNVVKVTPELAAKFLESNNNNRNVRKGHVSKLAEAMLSGEWKLSPQPVSIAKNVRLLDGQHRLLAIVQSGVPQNMMICEGVEESVFDVIDIGAKRSYSDLSGLPKPVAITVSTLAKLYYGSVPTPQKIHPFNEIYGGIALDLHQSFSGYFKIITSGAMKAAACYMIKKHGCTEYVVGQLKAMAKQDFKSLSPINESLLRVVMRQATTGKQPFTPHKIFNYGVKAFDHRLKNKLRISADSSGIYEFKEFTKNYL